MTQPIHSQEVSSQKGPAERFTGNVALQNLASAKNVSVIVYKVTFEKNAHTNWHTHSEGQVLYFLEGKGRVEIEGQGVIDAVAGDVVEIPANTRHWHGAHPDEENKMVHLAITYGDTTWMETVPEKVYFSK